MKTSEQLRDEIRQANQMLAAHKPKSSNLAPPFPSRQAEGYRHGECTDSELAAAQAIWQHNYAEPAPAVRARLAKRRAEAELEQAEKAEAADAEMRAAAAAQLEERCKAAYLSRPGTTEQSWQQDRALVLQEARVHGKDPIDVRKAELLRSGAYERF